MLGKGTDPMGVAGGWRNAGFFQKSGAIAGLAIALIMAVLIIQWSWSPGYKILFSSVSDREVSTILNALYSNGIEVKLDETSGAILVPSDKVHFARIRLSYLGLPGSIKSLIPAEDAFPKTGLHPETDVESRFYSDPIQYKERVLSHRVERILEPVVGADSVRAQVSIYNSFDDSSVEKNKKTSNEKISSQTKKLTESNKANQPDDSYALFIGDKAYLSITVIVDDRKTVAGDKRIIKTARTEDEIETYTAIVKNAVDFNEGRGDIVKVINSRFAIPNGNLEYISPGDKGNIWIENILLNGVLKKSLGMIVVILITLLFLWYLARLFSADKKLLSEYQHTAANNLNPIDPLQRTKEKFNENMRLASILSDKDPKLVAQILKNWVNADGR